MKLTVINTTTDKKSSITLKDELVGKKVNSQLLAQAIKVYLANQRQGTSKTQTRSQVSLTSKKMYRQKGTGGARHGDKTATIFVGGATAHGPRGIENWKLTLSKREKLNALKSALLAQEKNIIINDEISALKGKTKNAAKLLSKLSAKKDKILIILSVKKVEIVRALRNISNVTISDVKQFNAYDLARHDKIIISKLAIKGLEKRLGSV